jgi:hypothetical protein
VVAALAAGHSPSSCRSQIVECLWRARFCSCACRCWLERLSEWLVSEFVEVSTGLELFLAAGAAGFELLLVLLEFGVSETGFVADVTEFGADVTEFVAIVTDQAGEVLRVPLAVEIELEVGAIERVVFSTEAAEVSTGFAELQLAFSMQAIVNQAVQVVTEPAVIWSAAAALGSETELLLPAANC